MKRNLHYVRILAAVASVALFMYMLRRASSATVLDKARLLGWGFAFLIVLSGAKQVLRTLAWHGCLEPDGRRPGLLDLFGLRLMGEAFNSLTPAGPLVGETAKVWAASRRMPAQSTVSSVVIENLIYYLAAVLFMLSAVVLVLLELAPSHRFRWLAAGLVICFLAFMLFAARSVSRRVSLVRGILHRLRSWGCKCAFLERYEHDLCAMETEIYDFFLTRRALFLGLLALEFATNFTGIGEAYLILKATTAHTSVLAAYLVESTNRAVQLVFAFVPLGLGVDEGFAARTLRTLGYDASEGVSLAIIRKIRTVFWVGVGLLLTAKYSMARSERVRTTYEATYCERG
jgi:uncharacterized membrane protein YbhN (UPF0104 family)